ncbi:MAG: hypothetical protein KMY55_01515 [Dethiosulfatibacter sp.]|nr:hypothetical protein [Dethiosulfatibacter sp.]
MTRKNKKNKTRFDDNAIENVKKLLVEKGKNNGSVKYQELVDLVGSIDFTPEAIEDIYKSLDTNGINILEVPDTYLIPESHKEELIISKKTKSIKLTLNRSDCQQNYGYKFDFTSKNTNLDAIKNEEEGKKLDKHKSPPSPRFDFTK